MQHHRAQPADLAPDAVGRESTILTDATGNNGRPARLLRATVLLRRGRAVRGRGHRLRALPGAAPRPVPRRDAARRLTTTSSGSSCTSTSGAPARSPAARRSPRSGPGAGRPTSTCSSAGFSASRRGSPASVWCASRPRSLEHAGDRDGRGCSSTRLPVYLVGFGGPAAVRAELRRCCRCRSSSTRSTTRRRSRTRGASSRRCSSPGSWSPLRWPRSCMRLTQAFVLDVLDTDYVRTAAAKGLSQRRMIRHHAAHRRLQTRWRR